MSEGHVKRMKKSVWKEVGMVNGKSVSEEVEEGKTQ